SRTTWSKARAGATSRPTSASPAGPSPTGSPRPARNESTRADPPEGGDPRPAGRSGRARASRARLQGGGERARRTARRARRHRGGPARAAVREAARQPARRGLRDRDRGLRFGVLQFPGSCDEADAVEAARHVGDAELIWHRDRDLQGADAIIVPGG